MRIVLIDSCSGYIWGDSADLDGRIFSQDDAYAIREDGDFALAYAEALDRSIGGAPRTYAYGNASTARDGVTGYRVFRADIDGSEAVGVVHDGQNKDTIDAVIENCPEIGFITCADPVQV